MSERAGLRAWHQSVAGYNSYNRRKWVAAEAARLPAGARVLDVGAGVGQYRPLFAHCEYRTQDFAQEPQTVGKYTPLDYVSDIVAIPVEDGAFDAVLCTEVLEHVPEPIRAVRELARILRPGGRLLLSAPLGSHLHQEPYHYYGGYTPHWYRRFLAEAGFDVEYVERNGGFFQFFGQESQRWTELVHPRNHARRGLAQRATLFGAWLASWPFARVLPVVGAWLDKLGLEKEVTVGYHVAATRSAVKSSADGK